MLGNGVVGILAERSNKWERRVPLTPSHCARLLLGGKDRTGVSRIIVQPSTKRIHHDELYEDVGCEISEDLLDCGLIVGIKQPTLDMILPDRAYAFFSHTHKAQKENMPLLDKVLAERASLFDYELIAGDHGKRLLAFGKYAGRAGLIDVLGGLGQRFLNLGYSTPFLYLGASYMYPSLTAAKSAIISVGEKIASQGLPLGICPLVFVFTGSGNVSTGAQEIFKLLPHTYVEPSELPKLFESAKDHAQSKKKSKRAFNVYGCVVTCQDMVRHKDPAKANFEKADYYAHPEHYTPIFHEKVAPYASVIVNCMYWEQRFPRLLSTEQLRHLTKKGCPLVGISDITCDIGGSFEFVNRTTYIESPFFRYDVTNDSYHSDMEGNGVICSAVDILPTEFAKEASQHFGNILSDFVEKLASFVDITKLPGHLQRACIAHAGSLTKLYEYIPRMRESNAEEVLVDVPANKKKHTELVSISGHLFDKFLINEALNIIEAAGGSFHLVKCHVGQSTGATSYSELEVGADDREVLDQIIDRLNSLANQTGSDRDVVDANSKVTVKVESNGVMDHGREKEKTSVLILGAGRVCQPAVQLLVSGSCKGFESDHEHKNEIQVIVGSLFLKEAEEIVEGSRNATAVQIDVKDHASLYKWISQADVVISLLPAIFHAGVASVCIELKKHLVTASYVDDNMSNLNQKAKEAGITILGEMGLDPGIDHMMAMKMIDEAHTRKGRIRSFASYCGGLPSPAAANNPLAYKFSWSPAGALRAGKNPAMYKIKNEIIRIDGDKLFDSVKSFRLTAFPAFALECLPNRDSLVYGDLYGISGEASTVFRGTLRYEGFSAIMGTLARAGFFDSESHQSVLVNDERTTFRTFLLDLLQMKNEVPSGTPITEKVISEHLVRLKHCKDSGTAVRTAKTIIFLGLHENTEIPATCQTPFDVTCHRMEEKLAYESTEQDMVLLHHEVEVEYPERQVTETHGATLLEFGKTENGKTTTAMALTVGIPAAIGALLLLQDKIKTRGILRPIKPEVYIPALEILQSYGIKLIEKIE